MNRESVSLQKNYFTLYLVLSNVSTILDKKEDSKSYFDQSAVSFFI